MATLFVRTTTIRDGSKRFSVVYRRGGRYFPTESAGTFKTRREALLRREAVAAMLAAGLNPKVELARKLTPGRTLESAAEAWMASKRGWAEGTRTGHRFRLPVVLEPFGRIDEITVDDVHAWVGVLGRKYAPGTVRLFVQQLRMILDHAGVSDNPARSKRVELPRVLNRTLEPPTGPQVLDALDGMAEDLVVPVLVMEQLGLRVGETMQLEPADVGDERLRVRGETAKTGKPRWVPAGAMLTDALMERLPFHGTTNRVRSALRHADAGFSPHDLRHRRASLWSAQGVPPAQAAAWLGHSVDTYLRTYTHVIVDDEIPAHELRALLQ